MPTVANIRTRQGVGLSLLLPARGWRDAVPRDTSPPALPPSAGAGVTSAAPPGPAPTHPGSAGGWGRPAPPQRTRALWWIDQASTWRPGQTSTWRPGQASLLPGNQALSAQGHALSPHPGAEGQTSWGLRLGPSPWQTSQAYGGGVAPTPCQSPRGADEGVVMSMGVWGRPWAEDLTAFPTSHPWGQRQGCCSL